MKNVEKVISDLYKKAAEYHGITVEELRYRIVYNGETLIYKFYVKK